MWIYTAVIRPMIAYGAVVWWPKSKQTTAKIKLNQVQRVACPSITGAMRTTPSESYGGNAVSSTTRHISRRSGSDNNGMQPNRMWR